MATHSSAVDPDPQDFDCPICQDVLRMPVRTKTCQHVFCRTCLETALRIRGPYCPLCRGPVTETQRRAADVQQRMRMLKATCRACGAEKFFSKMRLHYKTCRKYIEEYGPITNAAPTTPATTPVQTPVLTPVQTPVHTSLHTSLQTPVQTPVHTSLHTSLLTPVHTSVHTSVLTPVLTPVHTSLQTPVLTPVHTSLQTSVHTSVQTPVLTPVLNSVHTSVLTPVHTSLQTSVHTSLQTPVQTPVLTPVHTSLQTSVHTSLQTPVLTPVHTSVQTPVQTPVLTPVHTSVQTPVQTPVHTSLQTPVLNPVQIPVLLSCSGFPYITIPAPSSNSGGRVYACPYCPLVGLRDAALVQHCVSQHSAEAAPAVCPICVRMPWGNTGYCSSNLIGHMLRRHRFSYAGFMDEEEDEDSQLCRALQMSVQDL